MGKVNPYYVYSPDYRESSSGIVVMHKLCHLLNEKGYDAYIVGATIVNPELNTPVLTMELKKKHELKKKVPIAIYPEVVIDNPLEAKVCVRYFLNKNGLLTGRKVNVSENDLVFYHSKELSEGEGFDELGFLSVDPTRHDLFYYEGEGKRYRTLFYINRIPRDSVDFLAFGDVEVLSPNNRIGLIELSRLFKEAKVLYTYEYSWTCILAILCGCPVVQMQHAQYPSLAFTEQHHKVWKGFGYVNNIKDISMAVETAPKISEVFQDFERDFEVQLETFISVTQKKAEEILLSPDSCIDEWLSKRFLMKEVGNKIENNSELNSKIAVLEVKNSGVIFKGLQGLGFFSELYYPGDCFFTKINDVFLNHEFDWFILLSEGESLASSGLLRAQIELSEKSKLSAICFDVIYRHESAGLGAAFRPSDNLDYLLSFPAGMSRHWLFNRKALLEIGGFNTELPEAFELDAVLRLINKGGLECIGHIAEPLVITPPPILANVDDERKAIEHHLHQRGYPLAEVHAPNPGRYQIRYNHPGQPIVSVVLAAGSNLSNLQRCVEGLLGNTSYQNFEILFIDQPSSAVEVKEWLAGLAAMEEPKLRVFSSMQQALSQQYNEVQQHAIGDYLLFLSADTAIISTHWLDEMLNHAQRGEVGVVGAKLLTPGGEIAHAGYILGLEGPVGSPFVGEPMDAPGYMQRLQVDQNLSAVGGDCLMVLRELFVQLDGFANGALADEYLSTDLCLRAREAGFLIVWTPHAQLMLDKPKGTRPSAEQEDVMYERWLPQLARDPAYNPNFSLSMPGGFKLADTQISWRPLDNIRPAPVALVHPADLFGCGHYRVMQPFLSMKEAGLLDGAISIGLMHVTDLERYNPDCIVLQRQIGDERLHAMQRMKRFSQAFKVYELDDYLPNLPLKSVHRKDMPKDILKSLRRGLSFVDRFVVSTPALAEAFAGLHGEIVVRENRLPLGWWGGLQTERRKGKKPRVGWAGGSSHTGDLELIADVVRDLADEVEWVFFGMCPEALKPYVHEFHGGVPIEQYPAKLASLNLDLGLAPLEHNLFNECKSNLRQLEYGVCGIPIICTDIRPYQDGLQAGLPVTLVKNRYKDWVDAIRMHINDLDATAKIADELQAKVLADWMLQGEHLLKWRDAWVAR